MKDIADKLLFDTPQSAEGAAFQPVKSVISHLAVEDSHAENALENSSLVKTSPEEIPADATAQHASLSSNNRATDIQANETLLNDGGESNVQADDVLPHDALSDEVSLDRLVHFIHEAGMLRHTPRTGYQFLGSGKENVAEHSYRVILIGYALAKITKADVGKTVVMCLIHDFHEARIGDFNYVNYKYNTSNPRRAMEDALEGTGLTELMGAWEEQETGSSPEAVLAHDADQLDLIFNLIQERALGNRYAEKWLASALGRLQSDIARNLAAKAMDIDPAGWWFDDPKSEWWITRGKKK